MVLPAIALIIIVSLAAFFGFGITTFLFKGLWYLVGGALLIWFAMSFQDDTKKAVFALIGVGLLLAGLFGSQFGLFSVVSQPSQPCLSCNALTQASSGQAGQDVWIFLIAILAVLILAIPFLKKKKVLK